MTTHIKSILALVLSFFMTVMLFAGQMPQKKSLKIVGEAFSAYAGVNQEIVSSKKASTIPESSAPLIHRNHPTQKLGILVLIFSLAAIFFLPLALDYLGPKITKKFPASRE